MNKIFSSACAALLLSCSVASADIFCAPRESDKSVLVVSQNRDLALSPEGKTALPVGSRFMLQGRDAMPSDRLLRGSIVQAERVLSDVWIDVEDWTCISVDFGFQDSTNALEAKLKF